MDNSEQRYLRLLKRQVKKMKNEKQKLSFYLVFSLFLISVLVVLMDILCVSVDESYSTINTNSSHNLVHSDDDTAVWETAPPLGIPLYRLHLRLYSSTLDSREGVSRRNKFQESLLARQQEMKQLMKNITASMSKNPLVKQIQASRAEYRYRTSPSLSIDPSLQHHHGHDAVWQPVHGTHHKLFIYSAFYDDREKPLVRVIATTKTKKSEKVKVIKIRKHSAFASFNLRFGVNFIMREESQC